MPRRHRADKRRGITNAQRSDLWLGPTCFRDHRMFGGVWCECSLFLSPAERERAFWSLPEEERRHYVALYDYDERFREATAEAEASGRDPLLVEIERGLLEPAELATLVSIGLVKVDPVLLERAEAARKALESGGSAGR